MLSAETVGEGVEVDMMARRSSRWFFCNLFSPVHTTASLAGFPLLAVFSSCMFKLADHASKSSERV